MEIEIQPKLKFRGVDIFNVEFNSLQPSIKENAEVKLSITPYVLFPEDEPASFKIYMNVKVELERFFKLALEAVGTFETIGADSTVRKTFVNQNAPAIMFPYIRAFITTLTGSLGNVTGLIVVPPHFFKGDVEELKVEPMKELAVAPEE